MPRETIFRKRNCQEITHAPCRDSEGQKKRKVDTQPDKTAPLGTMIILNELGIQCHRSGKVHEAAVLFRESLGCITEECSINELSMTSLLSDQEETTKDNQGLATSATTNQESQYDEGMHAYKAPMQLENTSCNDTVVATLRYNVGLALVESKDFKGALPCFSQALEHMSSNDTSGSSKATLDRLKIHHNIAYCQYRLGDRQSAMDSYLQALLVVKADIQGKYDLAVACNCLAMIHLREKEYNSNHCLEWLHISLSHFSCSVGNTSAESATVFFNIGQTHFYRDEYPQALVAFQEAYRIRKELLGGKNNMDVAICIFGIGQTFHKLGLLGKAMNFFKKFLEISESPGVTGYHDFITALNSIALLHRDKGDHEEAYTVFERALMVGVGVLGGSHPSLAPTLISFGSLCFQMSKFDIALKLYEQCLKVQKEDLGASHPDTINTLLSIAQIHWHVGRYRSAWMSFKGILELQVQSLGSSSLPVASTVSSMALIYCQMKEYEDALELYQEALRIRRDCLAEERHPDITATLNTIGLVLCKLHKFKLAKETFQECLRHKAETLGSDHLDVSTLMHNLAAVNLDLGEDEDAIEMLEMALKIRKGNLGPDHPEVASTLHHLGQAYQIRGLLEKAAEAFQEGLQIEKRSGSNDKVVIHKLLNLIGNIHLMLGQVPEMMDSFVQASRIEEGEETDFLSSLVVAGHNFYDLSRLHPECAPLA